MPRPIPPPLSLALKYLRTARGWTEQELATAAGTARKVLSDYETGSNRTLSREKLDRLVSVMGYEAEDVDLVLLLLAALGPAEGAGLSPAQPSQGEVRRARRGAARAGLTAASLTRAHLLDLARLRREQQARRQAAQLWGVLRRQTPGKRRELIESSREFQHWALAERLCAESVRAAADDATEALELARLGLRAAELAPGGAAWRTRLKGYAFAFVGNAQRVGNDLAAAEASFATAWRRWREGGAAAGGALGEWRLLDLEASLRRAQRRFEAALGLLERALALAPADARGRILLNRAFTLEQAGDVAAATATLREAAPLVAAAGEPRERFGLLFNLLVTFCHLGRYHDAEAGLPALRALTFELGNRLDLLRVMWLSGRVAAGLGRGEEARAAFEQVRREFAALGNGYDAALASLELAVLHLEEGRPGEVRALAAEMVATFGAQRVHREALAALALFRKAAEAETATAELARRLIDYLERARHDPRLRFDGRP
jgi:transcriptional regulator with XRE-family HTH domain